MAARGDLLQGSRGTATGRGVAWPLVLLLLLVLSVLPLSAQAGNTAEAALTRALDLEGENKCREAIPLYRQAITVEDPSGVVLGLERCYAMIGRPDSLIPLLDSLLLKRPKDPTLRTVQLRTLSSTRRDQDLSVAFGQWVSLTPQDPGPYRTYAQILLEQGRARGADSVLREAAEVLGSSRALASEFAQMQSALGLWTQAATSWRDAVGTLDYLEGAAVFGLMPVPTGQRDSIRTILSAAPAVLSARRVLAGLELKWRAPRRAWDALAGLTPDDSVVAAWLAFAAEAEGEEAWLTARDALGRVMEHQPTNADVRLRGATAALNGGDASSALALLATSRGGGATETLLTVRALGALGRAADAERLVREQGAGMDSAGIRLAHRALAWAWIRAGELPRARAALAVAGETTDEGERVAAWLALYEGDLKTARRGLRRTDEPSHDVVTAMALLSRTRADSSAAVGQAFLTLARADTGRAARAFDDVAASLTDAAPFLEGIAARLYASVGDTTRAVTLWQRLIEQRAESPEAAESDLAWARVLRQRGDTASAILRLEHLILTFPRSALVPQARREMELIRGAVPSGDAMFLSQVVRRDGRWPAGGPPPIEKYASMQLLASSSHFQ